MDKLMKLLEIAKKFGVKPSKVIGTQGNIVPFKKPSLVDIRVDEFKLKDSIDQGAITMDKVKQEMEETVKLALSKNLNDVELNRALNNAINIDRQFFPPAADVYKLGVGETVTGKGLEELIQKQGRKYKPTSLAGEIETTGKQLENVMDDIGKQFGVGDKTNLDIDTIIKDAAKGQLSLSRMHNEGLVRAVTRQILSEDIKAGKIKGLTLEDLGTSREPINYFRKIYGEDALERLDSLAPDFNRLTSEQEAAKLARSKFTIEPKEVPVDESMTYDELGNLIKKGPDEPETKADGGRIGYAKGKKVVSSIDKLLEQLNTKLSKKTSMESVNSKTGEVTIPKKPLRKAEEPTGVTVMDNEPDTIDEKAFSKTKSRQLTKEEIEDYEAELGDSETWLSEGTVEEAEKALKKRKDEYAYYYQQYKMGKLDPVAGDKSESRMKFLRKKAQEAEMTGDRRLITSDEMDELSDLESTYLNDVDEAYGMDTSVKKEMKQAMKEGVQKTNRMTELGLDPSNSKDYDKFLEMEAIKQKYGNVIDDNLLQQILVDDNPQRKAEVLASIDEAIKMQEKGIPSEEIINIIKNTTRTKQANGGIAGLL